MRLEEEFQKYFSGRITKVDNLNHCGNNKLFSVTLPDGKYLLKLYSHRHMDCWNRGESEFKALSFLNKKGFEEVPKAISFWMEDNAAVYSYAAGRNLDPFEIMPEYAIKAADFLARLHSLSSEDKKLFGPASSACLSLENYIEVIDRRLAFVSNPEADSTATGFLEKKVKPRINELRDEFRRKTSGIDTKKTLPIEKQVLTPADFGFHNILVSSQGYTFIDFEYFGRDDPARQILDFIHHDKSKGMGRNLKNIFWEAYTKNAKTDSEFMERIYLADPLVGMAWVLIFLNVLSKEYLEHLRFSREESRIPEIIKNRIKLAEVKLTQLRYF